ncbi:uncharacterized protein LOC111265376 isoform X1 [Varroa jacobsoni]|uniref:uncharacterized protein LOC111265376 isoform X1 n=1 Tax=Varroa jacobsoni TaxID=62625 RepID=UPI000BF34B83|nr:uncharacterized protein LOC111265376 isoform X1 [Varroa jacobsoni]
MMNSSAVSKGGRKLITGNSNDLTSSDETSLLNMNLSNISIISGACMNSTIYGGRSTLANAKRAKRTEQKSLDVLEILKKNYGIVLPKPCEERIIKASLLHESKIQGTLGILEELPTRSRAGGDVTSLIMDSDMVDQLHHLTRYRREFLPLDGISDIHNRVSQWTEAELERGSELMGSIQKKAASIIEILRLIGDFGVSLDLIRQGDNDM